ncbi:MAG TPA: hypothetical protein VFV41_25900, partial [Streptosporangiaceae bacterium]|nr:hypothetical protein [Streptosporangiaceae bacterium]
MRIGAVTSTMLFAGPVARPRQIVQVTLHADDAAGTGPGGAVGQPATVGIAGPGISTPEPAVLPALPPGGEHVAEVGIEASAPASAGSVRPATVIAAGRDGDGRDWRAEQPADITIAEPGWTMWMVSHFHYDPVWWSTQGQFLQSWFLLPGPDGQPPEVRTAFELVKLHLAEAR